MALAQIFSLAQLANAGRRHRRAERQRGEALHAVIVPKDGAAVTPEERTTHCRQHTGGYKLPRSYEFRSEPLPVTSVGKARKNVLRDPWWAGGERKI